MQETTPHPLEEKINQVIYRLEKDLINGRINSTTPEVCLEEQTKLSSYLSMCIGLIERLDIKEAQFFVNNRNNHKSDLGVKKEWKTSNEGIRQEFWENRCKRIKVLIDALEKLYYHAKMERQLRSF